MCIRDRSKRVRSWQKKQQIAYEALDICEDCIEAYMTVSYTHLGLIPMKWITIFAVVVGCSFLILLLLNFKKLPTWGLVMKRFVLIVLTVCIGTCGYFLDKSRTTINKISKTTVNEDGSTTKKSKMFVVVKKDADIQDLDDLKDQKMCIRDRRYSQHVHYLF